LGNAPAHNQRTRQLGLLRSIGASGSQVRFLVLFESVIIGVVASVIGLFGGIGVAWLLKQLFSTGGNSFPDGPLELRPRTIAVVVIVGLVVTVLSALIPAIRASRVAPLEAVRDGGVKQRSMRFRLTAGSIVLLPGMLALGIGMFGNVESTAGRLSLIGIGAGLTFIGVSMLSALFAGPAAEGIGRATFIAFASFVGGLLLIVLGIGSAIGSLFVLGSAFRQDDFWPIGVLLIVAGVAIMPLAYVFVRSGIPTVADGFRLVKGVFTGGASLTLVNLARDNASRNPQRTAATSTALMIGLALITGVAVLTASLLATFDKLLEEALTADLFIFEENQGLEFSPLLVDQLDALPETEAVAGFRSVKAQLGYDNPDGGEAISEIVGVSSFDTATGSAVVNVGVEEGTAEISTSGIGVLSDTAADNNLTLGDTVSIEFEDGFTTELTIETLFTDNSIVEEPWIISRELSAPHAGPDAVEFIGLTFPEGTDPDSARLAVEEVTENFPQLSVQDNTEFQEQIEGQINQIQVVISGLLVLSLVVAFFGIVNTMALSVLERTREIGLLRAVGMTRTQLRSTIRSEAIVVSVFGALLGVAMGLLLGWAAVVAIPDSFISQVGIPWLQLVAYVIVGVIIGLVAAYFPARRAAQLNVLDAIAHE